MNKAKTLKKLNNKAWKLMSEWIRRRAADWRGFVMCVTCSKSFIWDSGQIHAGHWIHDKLDYDERNVHPQCRKCNYKYNKNVNTMYAIFMAKTYGAKGMAKIRRDADTKGNLYTYQELNEIIENLKVKIASLQ